MTEYVINELLAYVFDKKDTSHENDIDKIVYKFYAEDAVKDAKKILWDNYKEKLPKWEERKNTQRNAKEKNVGDILAAVKIIDQEYSGEDDLPIVFAAVMFSNIPSQRFVADCDVRDRLKAVELQIAELMSTGTKTYAATVSATQSQQTSGQPRVVEQPMRQPMRQPITRNRPMVPQADHVRAENVITVPTDNNGGVHNDNKWNDVHQKKRRRTKVVYGKHNNDVIKGGHKKQELFLFSVRRSVTDDKVEEYIKSKGTVDLISLKCVSHDESASKSYHVILHTMDMATAMDPAFWPVGVAVRRYFKKRTQDSIGGDFNKSN